MWQQRSENLHLYFFYLEVLTGERRNLTNIVLTGRVDIVQNTNTDPVVNIVLEINIVLETNTVLETNIVLEKNTVQNIDTDLVKSIVLETNITQGIYCYCHYYC